MKCFLRPTSTTWILYILNQSTEGWTLHNKYRKWSTYHHSHHPQSLHTTCIAMPIYNFFLLETFFRCLLPEADGSLFSSSLEKITLFLYWPGSTFLLLFFHVSFEDQFHNCPSEVSRMIRWKQTHLPWRSLQLRNLFNNSFLSKDHMLLARKPYTKLVDFKRFTNLSNKLGSIIFQKLSLY